MSGAQDPRPPVVDGGRSEASWAWRVATVQCGLPAVHMWCGSRMPVVAAYHMVAVKALTTARPPSLSLPYLALPNIAAALLSQGRGRAWEPPMGRWRAGLGLGSGLGRETVIGAGGTLSVPHATWIALVSSWSTPHGFICKADNCPNTIFITTRSCVTTSCSCSVV